jgi:hypothetical protein
MRTDGGIGRLRGSADGSAAVGADAGGHELCAASDVVAPTRDSAGVVEPVDAASLVLSLPEHAASASISAATAYRILCTCDVIRRS